LKVVVLNWRNYLGIGSLYVNRMYSMVQRHLTLPYEFVEVTEHDLHRDYRGWFNKLELLELFDDEVLYLDLDVVISGPIDHLIEYARNDPTKIYARDDWSYPVTHPQNGREATINSSVLYWSGRKDMAVTDKMIEDTHGDQGIITQLFWPTGIRLFPNSWIRSWKYDAQRGPITVFHGEPKQHQLTHDPFIRGNWR